VTYDPVPDHGMSRSRLLTNHDEFTTVAFSSLCNDVQSGIMNMSFSVNIFIVAWHIYSKSYSLYSLHGSVYKLNTVNSSLIFLQFDVLHVYTSPNHGSKKYDRQKKEEIKRLTSTWTGHKFSSNNNG